MHLRINTFTVFFVIFYILGLMMTTFMGVISLIIDGGIIQGGAFHGGYLHLQLAGIGLLLAGIMLCLYEAYKKNPENWEYSKRDLELMEELRKVVAYKEEHRWDAVKAAMRATSSKQDQEPIQKE